MAIRRRTSSKTTKTKQGTTQAQLDAGLKMPTGYTASTPALTNTGSTGESTNLAGMTPQNTVLAKTTKLNKPKVSRYTNSKSSSLYGSGTPGDSLYNQNNEVIGGYDSTGGTFKFGDFTTNQKLNTNRYTRQSQTASPLDYKVPKAPTLRTVNEKQVRDDVRKRMQGSIDAINKNFSNLISQEKVQGEDRLGQTRALNARSGTLGSDFGQAAQQKTVSYNKQQEQYLRDQQNAQIAQIMNSIEDRASSEIASRKQEALGKYEMDMTLFEKNKESARTDMQALAKKGVPVESLAPAQKAALYKQAGYDPQMGDLIYKAMIPQTDWKFEVMGNKLVGFGIGADGGVETKSVDLPFTPPAEMNFQVQDDGTALLIPKSFDMSKPIDEQIFMYGQQGQFSAPSSENSGFTLQPGEMRYDAYGNLIASAPKEGSTNEGSKYLIENNSRAIQSVDELLPRVNNSTVGFGSFFKGIPTSAAADFEADLSTLKSNIAFGQLTAMREASKTGGALGSIAIQELNLLESTLGGLDMKQSPDNFKKNLLKIKESITRWNNAVMQNGGGSGGSLQYTTPDGNVYEFPDQNSYQNFLRDSGLLTGPGFNKVGNTSASGQVKGMQVKTPQAKSIDFNQQNVPLLQKTLTTSYPEGSVGPGSGVYEGQCGVFVRDVVKKFGGTYPSLGDSLQSKISAVQKHGKPANQATIGSVIVTRENPTYGHVAYIIGKNEQGWIVAESNFKQSKRVSYGRTIPYNSPKIIGVINPTAKG